MVRHGKELSHRGSNISRVKGMALRIGHLSTFYHTAILLMTRRDLIENLGIDIEWRLFGTGPAIVDAFSKGEIDLAYIGLPPAIIGIVSGTDIVCIAGGHIEGTVLTGKEGLLGFPEEQDLALILGQLKGKRIGVPGKGSIHDVIISDCLEKFNLKKTIEIVNFEWSDQITEAMHKDKISAAAGTPALAVAVKRYANGQILYPPSKLWPNNPSYGILVHRNFLKTDEEILKRFLLLHEETTSYIRNKPRQASREISDYIGFIDEEFVLETLKVSPKYCAQLTDGYISSTMEFVKALKRMGYIDREITADEVFDLSLIRKIHTPGDHYADGISDS